MFVHGTKKVLVSLSTSIESDFHITISKQSRHHKQTKQLEAQWLSGRVLDSRPRGQGFKPHRRHCVVSLSKTH